MDSQHDASADQRWAICSAEMIRLKGLYNSTLDISPDNMGELDCLLRDAVGGELSSSGSSGSGCGTKTILSQSSSSRSSGSGMHTVFSQSPLSSIRKDEAVKILRQRLDGEKELAERVVYELLHRDSIIEGVAEAQDRWALRLRTLYSLLAGLEELRDLLQEAKDQENKDDPRWMKTLKLKIMNLDPSDPFVLEHKVAEILKSWDSKINNAAPVHKQAICDWLLSNNLVDRIFICHRELKAIRTVAPEATAEVATRALRWTAPDALDFLKSLGSVLHIEDPVLLIAEVTTQDLAASDAKFFLSHGQQSIRIEASSCTPAIQELATAIGSLSPCSVSFQLRNSTASVADVAKPVHNQPHTLDGSEAVPAGPINKVRLTEQHAGSADMLYHVKYEGLGDYPAQMQYQVKVIRDRSFPTTIPVHFALDLDQPFKRSQVLRVEWSGKMKDSVFVTWRSDFLRNINRPVRVEETITRTLEGTLGGGFPASLNLGFSRAGSRTVTTQYDPLPFDTTYISNGVSSKGLSIKPSTKHPDIDWPNLDFGTNVSQIVIRSPRGLITHCQAVYGLIPFKAAELTRIEIGTEYVIVAEVDIPSIDDDRKDIELEHGSDYLANARKDEVDRSKGEREERHGEKKAEQQAEGHGERQAEGWLLRTFRRLRGLPHDRRAEQEIGRTVARSGQTASTNSVASQPIVRKCWYNLFAKDSLKLIFVKATTDSDHMLL